MAIKLKDLDTEARKLSEEFRDEIAHQYDKKMTDRLSGFVNAFVSYFFICDYDSTGIDTLTAIPADVPIILSAVHKSHLDYILLGLILFENNV